ncbi:MAG TPA: hypothetical protein EYP24_02200 [bacterium (Candidatus Stahlbacteria)]|nr:hypothetical protein [Candidatus Stahlbacteria bacterium]
MLRVFLVLLIFLSMGQGMVVKRGNRIVVGRDVEIDDDLLVFARSIDIKGMVNGNLYLFAQDVKVSGEIEGSIHSFAASADFDAVRVRSIIVFGGSVSVSGDVENNLLIFGGDAIISDETTVGKDLKIFSGRATMSGDVTGTFRFRGGQLVMSGKSGKVVADCDEMKIQAPARIGDLIIRSKKKPLIEPGAEITGEMRLGRPEEVKGKFFYALAPIIATIIGIIKIVVIIAKVLVGIILIAVVKNYVRRVMNPLIIKPWHSLGLGFLGLVVIPVAVAILSIILVGFPFGVLGLYLYTILLYLAPIFVSLVIGELVMKFFRREGEINLFLAFIVGFVILFVIGLIPIIGLLVRIATLLFGAGAILFGSWELIREARSKALI